jgi:hypothetical protein
MIAKFFLFLVEEKCNCQSTNVDRIESKATEAAGKETLLKGESSVQLTSSLK